MSRNINVSIERKICAESMGRCMNPECKVELFSEKGDITEKAHIIPYCKTKDNTYENLIILCPNCHTKFDKNEEFDASEVKKWKEIRRDEFDSFFNVKYDTFDELKSEIVPLLLRNREIFESYYVQGNKELWDVFEKEILSNNRKIKSILEHNTRLIQSHSHESYSNQALIRRFVLHIDEFEITRPSQPKIRNVLFPAEINSLFGIEPVIKDFLPSVESIECLIESLMAKGEYHSIALGVENPYIEVKNDDKFEKIYLNDTPRLRQIYHENNCFRKVDVRFDSLNFALKYIKDRGLDFRILKKNNLKEVIVNGKKIVFIYEYCLSKVKLQQLCPEEKTLVVNLHNWNSDSCISREAYEFAKMINVTLLTMDRFYGFIYGISSKR